MPEEQRERLDIVDEHDRVIKTVFRDEVVFDGKVCVRAVNGFVINSKGQLWIPRRAVQKRVLPNALDFSVSGCVSSGENYETAFARELEEELGLKASEVSIRVLGYFSPQAVAPFFMYVYEIRAEEVPNYNKNDYQGYKWYAPDDLVKELEAGCPAKRALLPLVKLFYAS